MQAKLMRTLAIVACMACSLTGLAQVRSLESPVVAELLLRLRAEPWTARADAYQRLRTDPVALSRTDVRRALVGLLERESRLIEAALRESSEQVGASRKYGEDYTEYVAQLGDAIDSFTDWSDSSQVCIVVRQAYDPGSQFAAEIARHGKVAIPCLVEMYRSDVGLTRAEAAPTIVQALVMSIDPLDADMIAAAQKTILQALHDPSVSVRINTVEALGRFGGTDMIGPLRQVVEADPTPEVGGGSIRTRATAAIAAIEQRAQSGR